MSTPHLFGGIMKSLSLVLLLSIFNFSTVSWAEVYTPIITCEDEGVADVYTFSINDEQYSKLSQARRNQADYTTDASIMLFKVTESFVFTLTEVHLKFTAHDSNSTSDDRFEMTAEWNQSGEPIRLDFEQVESHSSNKFMKITTTSEGSFETVVQCEIDS